MVSSQVFFWKPLGFQPFRLILLPRSKLSNIAETCKSDELPELCSLYLSEKLLRTLMFFLGFVLFIRLIQFLNQADHVWVIEYKMQIVIVSIFRVGMLFVCLFFSWHHFLRQSVDSYSRENSPVNIYSRNLFTHFLLTIGRIDWFL